MDRTENLDDIFNILNKDSISISKISASRDHDYTLTPDGSIQYINSKKSNLNSRGTKGRWTDDEHKKFLQGIRLFGKDWRKIQ